MLNSMTYLLPEKLERSFRAEIQKSVDEKRVASIWSKDASVWTGDDEGKWLGWLEIVSAELGNLQKYRDLRSDIESAGFTDVLLMGMGGSSLCPEVLAKTFGIKNFHILDSTVPAQIISIEDNLDLETTLFIVASKSGSTLEPNCFKQYFFDRISQIVGAENAGKQFIAITDPRSKMQQVAEADGFRYILYGNPEIGGRFSALSAFGLTAAAVMGLDLERFLNSAAGMIEACKDTNVENNPGALLGTILGICHRDDRDKLTIFTSPEIYDVGAWLEQLIAESTGKKGVSIIPIDREPLLPADAYSNDRIFVNLKLKNSEPVDELISGLDDLRAAGHPVVEIEIQDIYDLGQEFFRWEFATAVAGAVMNINPFNQPDVESAKIEARKITDEYEKTGSLPEETPFFEENGFGLFSSTGYAAELTDIIDEETLAGYIEGHLWNLAENDYFAILAYVEMNEETEEILQSIRVKILESNPVATCLGFGPRFLHSTGQAYKGGANNGVFLQITSDDETDLPVPGQKYTFGVVKAAQARGDFQVLLDRERQVLRIHIQGNVVNGLRRIMAEV